MATAARITPNYFSTLFKKHTGKTFLASLADARTDGSRLKHLAGRRSWGVGGGGGHASPEASFFFVLPGHAAASWPHTGSALEDAKFVEFSYSLFSPCSRSLMMQPNSLYIYVNLLR
jgi:AraC-like DNA-binding protein